jgi:probable phosphoglycerate mutase
MTIVLVRHGETAGNAGLVLQKPDIPLNERGLQQAELLAVRLAELGSTHILCSDLLRAKMTALPLSKRTGLAIEESAWLQERNFGDLRGTPYAALSSNPFGPDFSPPNGEDWAAFYLRVAQAFELIVARRRALADKHGTLVVVTHGLVCRALVDRHLNAAGLVTERFDNTSVTIFDAEPPHAVSLLNCTRHLSATAAVAGEGGAV